MALVLQVLRAIPVIGDRLAIGLVLVGLSAVLVTYGGLTRFVPATMPD